VSQFILSAVQKIDSIADLGGQEAAMTDSASGKDRSSGGDLNDALPQAKAHCVTTDVVLHREYQKIWGADEDTKNINVYFRKVNRHKQAALCLSGGGIRSAAFGLGVLQALSRNGLLTGFHYLSTVSGGGYIGSWLQRWIHSQDGDATAVMSRLGARTLPAPGGASASAESARLEPDQVKQLRENSNFITPKVGLFSNDTWTALAISIRNIVINWLLFAPLIMLLALVPNLFAAMVESIGPATSWRIEVYYLLMLAIAAAVAWATMFTVRLLPSYRDDKQRENDRSRARFGEGDKLLRMRIVFPLLAWSLVGTLALSVELLSPQPVRLIDLSAFGLAGVDLAIFSLAGMFLGFFVGQLWLADEYLETFRMDWAIWPIAFAVTTSSILLGAMLLDRFLGPGWSWSPIVLAVVGPLLLLAATLVAAIAFAAFRKSEGPRVRPDGDREWLGRLSAIKLKPMLFWAVVAPSVLVVTQLWQIQAGEGEGLTWPGLVALITGATAAMGGRSQHTGEATKPARPSLLLRLPLSILVGLATLIFIVALLIVFGAAEEAVAQWLGGWLSGLLSGVAPGQATEIAAHSLLALGLGFLIVMFGRKISVNRFSLNGFYRNRLARAFLGAARSNRTPDPFTGFDSRDNVRLHQLDPHGPSGTVLYPVINAALNVTATENLAWQERRAMPFIFTPLFSGSGMLARFTAAPTRRTGAYVESVRYAAKEPDFGMEERYEEVLEEHKKRITNAVADDAAASADGLPAASAESAQMEEAEAAKEASRHGVTLSMAMTISGAAATPNMGYHSSAATAFLMTLFNVRLGAWLPNPALAGQAGMDITRSHPTNSISAMVAELSGATHDRGPDVYLSDGGHFENLALYEMIRRRCKYMFVSDAGADPRCAFEDLGNAVRKVKIDFDVDIDFPALRLAARGEKYEPPPQLAWALGKVTYPEKDWYEKDGNRFEGNLEGWILYLKPSFFGSGLPADVIAYARANQAFPHESTGDQFFSESQFESYRRLADHFVEDLVGIMKRRNPTVTSGWTVESLFLAMIAEDSAPSGRGRGRGHSSGSSALTPSSPSA
jgi:hypothetical protein